ncbi:unnamed protein product [Miscanthus lutarioriparius]|uniref:RING-type domain-containing protein n=1 Tax=Miscanthus lutarioriparius TaxID=422564 RepID=A0A811ND74_9POAL|nr:unnamed protein product [Miscanthus lutarioriparius]
MRAAARGCAGPPAGAARGSGSSETGARAARDGGETSERRPPTDGGGWGRGCGLWRPAERGRAGGRERAEPQKFPQSAAGNSARKFRWGGRKEKNRKKKLTIGLHVSVGDPTCDVPKPNRKWWTDCNLAGALGLLRILIYKVYADGTTTMCTHERKANIREFYAVIFPSLMQLHEGINEVEDKKQKAICLERYRRRDEDQKTVISEIDDNIEEECGICMEINSKVVLPTCSHAMCIKCYRDWRLRSQSCPFCRDSLKRVNSADLWVYTDNKDIVDVATVRRENLRRLFTYIDKLPTVIPESVFDVYDSHVK